MPVPFIPPELVSVILAHFHCHVEDEAKMVEDVGKSASLVCRSWRTLGQALRWRTLSVEPSSASSLLDHLVSHPHITNLVFELRIGPSLSEEEDQEEGEEETDKDYAPSIELLSKFPDLRTLDLELSAYADLDKVVVLASNLQKLEELHLMGTAHRVTPQVKIALLKGYPVVRILALRTVQIFATENVTSQEEEESAVLATSPKSRLGEVGLMTWLPGEEAPATSVPVVLELFNVLKVAFDWSRIQTCHLGGSFLDKDILLELLRQSTLARLDLSPAYCDLGEVFSTIVAVLPHMTNVKTLLVEMSLVEEDVLVSPVVIWDFLDLIPLNLKLFVLPQVAFDPDDFYEFLTNSEMRLISKLKG
ncbi:uncharacterized protein JCM6883_003834 [Sporobolomyces salmoneus]|uniref:uncharacterized protein n=1 Tax=Sporobolomyces salmoneus TaxID=183962 RepID=UPI00316D9452